MKFYRDTVPVYAGRLVTAVYMYDSRMHGVGCLGGEPNHLLKSSSVVFQFDVTIKLSLSVLNTG
jgi:hypothetical protein